ncbi:unnamed protein product, partial [Prorocentrum cordatum]
QVQGTFPLTRGQDPRLASQVGTIDIIVRWRDDSSAILGSVAHADHQRAAMFRDELYQITWQRIARRLEIMGISQTEWFYQFDVDKDGFWTRDETRSALSSMPVGLSPEEIDHVFVRMDSRK